MIFVIFLSVLVQSQIQIVLLTSPFTSESLQTQLASDLLGVVDQIEINLNLPAEVEILWSFIDLVSESDESLWSLPAELSASSAQVVLDAANSLAYSIYLASMAPQFKILHVVVSRPMDVLDNETPYPNTLFAETTYISQATAIFDFISQHSWVNIGLIEDVDINNSQLSTTLQGLLTSPMKVLDQIVIDPADVEELEGIKYRLQSTMKDSNARVVVVMCDASIAAQVLMAADESVMGGVGYTWILNSDAMVYIGETLKNSNADIPPDTYGVLKTGAVGIMAEDAVYQVEEPMSTYTSVLTLICQGYARLSNPTGTDLYNYIMTNPSTPSLPYSLKFDRTGVKAPNYLVYNIVNFAEILVGYWDSSQGKVVLNEGMYITWPGFTRATPNDLVPIIQLALLYPANDGNGVVLDLGVEVRQGFDLAISEINASPTLLSGYLIQAFYVDTFELSVLASANLKALAPYNILGFVGPESLALVQAYVGAESTATDPKPFITYAASSTIISNSVAYSSLLQIIQPNGLQAVALALFLQLQGWHSVGVIYTDDEFGQEVYSSFLNNVGTLEVSIINSEEYRAVSYSLDSNGQLSAATKSSVGAALDEIVRNQIKIIVFLGNILLGPELAKQGSEKELAGGDYAWLGCIWLTNDTLSNIDVNYPNDKSAIFSVLEGAIGLDYRSALGSVGAAFSASYQSAYSESSTTFSMLSYDSVYTYANVINGMIGRGDDYNSGTELTNNLRSADLTGASGTIKFSEGSNGRSAYGYNIVNIQDSQIVEAVQYDPLSANLFTALNNATILWGYDSLVPPVDTWPVAYDCPFASHMSKISPSGVGIIISIGTFLVLTTLGLSYFSFKKWKQMDIRPITESVHRSWKDTLVQAQIGIEFFQFLAIAPTFSSMEIVVSAASNIFMLDIMKVANTSKADYWILLAVVCALCYCWFFLVVLIMFNGEHTLKKIPLCKRTLSILNSVFLPFYGNTLFLPALALLLDAFVCDHEAQGYAYVWRDCYTRCWEGRHATFIIMSSVAVVCYEPIAAYSRPLWQQSRTGLNLKIQPYFLLLKTCMQILLIAIGKSLQSISPVAHGVVYTILISMFSVAIYKMRPFNYNRCNLWEFTSILCVAYMSFLATLSYSTDPTNVGWFLALMAGWIVILGVAFLVQKRHMPNLLITQRSGKGKNRVYAVIGVKSDSSYLDQSSMAKQEDFRQNESAIQPNDVEIDNCEVVHIRQGDVSEEVSA